MTYQTTFLGGDFAAYYRIRAKLLGGSSAWSRVLVAAAGLAELAIGGLLLLSEAGGFGGALCAMGLLFLIVGLFYYPVMGWRSAKAIPADIGELTYTFEEDGFTQAQSRGSAKIEYSRIFACAESKTVFAIFYDETHGVFLPKRSVPEPDALAAFLEEKLGFPLRQFDF